MTWQPSSPVPSHKVLSTLEKTRESTIELIQLEKDLANIPQVLVLKEVKSRRKTQEISVHCLALRERVLCPRLYFYEETASAYQLVMQHFPRGSLAARIVNRGRVPAGREAMVLALDLLQSLSVLHRQSVTHGDVKPLNVLCTEDDHYVICDFGHAKLHEREGENFEADEVNDSYSVGCTLLEAFLGRVGLNYSSMCSRQLSLLSEATANQPPSLSTALRGLLDANPKQRLRCINALQLLQEGSEDSTDTLRSHTRRSSQSSVSTTVMSRYAPLCLEENVGQNIKRFEVALNTILEMQTPQIDIMGAKVDELLRLLQNVGGSVRICVKGEVVQCYVHGGSALAQEAVHLKCACIICKKCLNSLVLASKDTVVRGNTLLCGCRESKFLPLEELQAWLYPATIAELDEHKIVTLNIRCPRCKQATNELHGLKAKTVTCLNCELSFCCFCYKPPHLFYCSEWRNRSSK
jgi:hypothetical protein